ncbi:MAG: Ig-like domain-containing protein [bacterium]
MRSGRASHERLFFAVAAIGLAAMALVILLPHHADAGAPPAATGGPDVGGYRFKDSVGGGLSHSWTALTGGTDISAAVSGDGHAAVPLPFAFNYYGVNYAAGNNVQVGENGWVVLSQTAADTPASGGNSYQPKSIPDTSTTKPNVYIAPLFVDLDLTCGGTVTYGTVGTSPNQEFVIQWAGIGYYDGLACSTPLATFQLRLQQTSNNILVVLNSASWTPDTDSTDEGSLIGIEETGADASVGSNTADDHGLQYFFQANADGSAIAMSGRSILFYRNQAPDATQATYTLDEDCSTGTSVSGCVSPYFSLTLAGTDSDGDAITYCIASLPTHGTLMTKPTSDCTTTATSAAVAYKPDSDYCNGPTFSTANDDTFTFEVKDANQYSSAKNIYLQVTCRADLPVATADSYTATEDTTLSVAASCSGGGPFGVKCSAGEKDVDDLQMPAPSPTHLGKDDATLVTGPMSGASVTLNADGSFSYTPKANVCGASVDSFTYKLLDDNSPTGMTPPTYSNTVTATISITCVNDAPTASNDPAGYPTTCYQVLQDSLFTDSGNTFDVLANDDDSKDSPPGTLRISSFTAPVHGTVQGVGPAGAYTSLQYKPTTSYSGPDAFGYTMSDGSLTASANVCIDVLYPDPHAVADAFTVNEDSVFSSAACAANTPSATGGPYAGVICNDVDGVNHAVTSVLGTGPTSGSLSTALTSTGAFGYTPTANYCNSASGLPDIWTYAMHDGAATINTVQVKMTVTCLNDGPVADTTQTVTMAEDATPSLTMLASDVDTTYGDTLTYCVVTAPAHGSFPMSTCNSYQSSPTATFTSAANYCGSDSLRFRVKDAAGLTDEFTVPITITCVNDAPTANDDNFYVGVLGHDMDTLARGYAPLVGNDNDVDEVYTAQNLQAVLLGPCSPASATVGSVTMGANGHFVYHPVGSAQYTTTFTYRAKDATAFSATCAMVTILVKPDAPPTSRFTASPTTVRVGEPVTFVDASTDADQGSTISGWTWTFGDGAQSHARTPVHSYGVVGTYTACLSAEDEWGVPSTSVACKTITVQSPTGPANPPNNGNNGGSDNGGGNNGNGEPLPPIDGPRSADAGTDQTVASGATVTLHGFATGGVSPTYEWRQTAGPHVDLDAPSTWTPKFTAPSPESGRVALYFEFAMHDGSHDVADGVTIIVQTGYMGPAAVAGADSSAALGTTAHLDGSGSSGGRGALAYTWTQLGGPAVSITDPMSDRATFVADEPGTYRFLLAVTDGTDSATDVQSVVVKNDSPGLPVSNDFTMDTGSDGTVSVVPDDATTLHTWDFGDGTPAAQAIGPTTHVYANPGTYVIKMRDASGTSTLAQRPTDVKATESHSRDATLASSPGMPVWVILGGAALLAGAVVVAAVVIVKRKPAKPAL